MNVYYYNHCPCIFLSFVILSIDTFGIYDTPSTSVIVIPSALSTMMISVEPTDSSTLPVSTILMTTTPGTVILMCI